MATAPTAHLGPPIDASPHLAPERAAFVELLEGLDEAAWRRPTACPGWMVLDIATHVLGDDLGRLARTRDAASGVAPRPGEAFPSFVHRLNDEWVRAAARLSPRLVVDLLRWSGPQLVELWSGLDLSSLGEPVTWAGPAPAPAWLDLARDFSEYWSHHQQVREAVGLGVGGPPAWQATVLATFARALPHTLAAAAPAGAAGRPGSTVVLDVPGPAGGTWSATLRPGGWELDEGAAAEPSAAVRLDADTFWRLGTGAASPAAAASRAELGGDRRLARAALELVAVTR